MKNATLLNEMPTNFYINDAQQAVDSINGKIAYCKDALACTQLKDWARKEYEAVLQSYIDTLPAAISRLETCKKMFS